MLNRIAILIVLSSFTLSLNAQLSFEPNLEPDWTGEMPELSQTPGNELLVNTRLFDFDSSLLDPWIDEITHLRVFGVDFRKEKNSEGLYQYVEESRMNDFMAFCERKNLKVVWTLNVSSFTLDQEMAYVKNIIDRGLNIVALEYGGEFYLRKYVFGDMDAKGVVERIRMDGENRDYLNLLDMWLPPMMDQFPEDEYEHILITASVTGEQNKTNKYRKEFNRKVFDYVKNTPTIKGKVSFSYHLYAGAKPDSYSKDEEAVITPEKVDWTFLNEKPSGSRWVVTESGYYVTDFSQSQLQQARRFYEKQSEKLEDNGGMMGIHTLINPTNRPNALALYNLNGITPVGQMVSNWLEGKGVGSGTAGSSEGGSQDNNSAGGTSDNSGGSKEDPELVKIYPEYGGFFDWIHFSQTLVFSNGKSYDRSYWFSSPDFTQDDLGKPLSYFKKVVKGR